MIVGRAFSRAHLGWKSAFWPNPLSVPARYFQNVGLTGQLLLRPLLRPPYPGNVNCWVTERLEFLPFPCFYGRAKLDINAMDHRKKQKAAVLRVWKPVSTKSGSFEGGEVEALSSCSCINEQSNISTLSSTMMASEVECQSQFQVAEEEPISTASKVENLPKDLGCGSVIDLELKEEAVEETLIVQGSDLNKEVGKISASVPVEASLIHLVNGKGESARRQIEEETGVKLILPSASSSDTCVVIEGNSIESVNRAAAKIKSVIEEAIKSPSLDYSHFISLPLAIHPELVDKLLSFQNTILGSSGLTFHGNPDNDPDGRSSDDKDDVDEQLENQNVEVKLEVQDNRERVRVQIDAPHASFDVSENSSLQILSDLGIDSSIFIKPKTFHLTVLMLKLWNKERIAAATEVLQSISSKVYGALENRPVSIRLKGLECMRGSPAKARVVYAPVEEIGGEGRLLRACQVIIKAYIEAGLVLDKDAQQPLKLHATLMNARHRKRSLKKKKKTKSFDSFDARGIFLRFGSKNWGDYLIREAHLSQRFKFSRSGYYHCCASIPFPEAMQVD